ncbi:cobalamin B12-binding domain-containing protein [Jiella mangrovi]|uniref:Cobalamin B12-binding domain-containing protein n=1 Tax=Jiella mangrovi TaxID=2821407 RepID=A0ABS4BDQ5_9HYPH|nr:cobalamin B12-binding domain-containing protein [Jiella mangrovi]MBP0614880.1 cobalamin B12-binding domain-containing protein [Jiella mangrovi]
MPGIPQVADLYSREFRSASSGSDLSKSIDSCEEGSWKGRLSEAIVAKVIPSLYAAHFEPGPDNQNKRPSFDMRRRAEADRFLGLVLSSSPDAQWQHLLGLKAKGMDLETLLMEIMAPAVRELGEMWLNDRMSFVEVTTKSARLQHMIRSLGRSDSYALADGRASILLAAAPGEQHTFGLFVMAEFFLAAGWNVSVEANATLDALCDLANGQRYDAIGMSVGSERFLPMVGEQVAMLRQASQSPESRIFLGGWAFTMEGLSLDDYGADLIAIDGRSAVERAESLLIAR